jgi:hypothetical protein
MRTTANALIVLLACCLSACAFAAVKKPNVDRYFSQFPQSQVVSLEPAAAIDASKSALEGMGYEIQAVNSDLKMVRTKARPALIPGVCDCGTWNGRQINGTGESSLMVTAERREENASLVSIRHECFTQFAGQNLYGATTRRDTYQCASNGFAEKEFWASLTKVVASRQGRH